MAWIAGAAAIGGGLLAYQGSQNTNEANSAQSQAQMDFQREMSNTSYQRGVADMKAAGLNPMLAYSQGGASTPGGSQAVMQNSLGAGVSSAQAAAQTVATVKNTAADTATKESQAALNKATALKTAQEASTSASTAKRIDQEVSRMTEENWGHIGSYNALTAERKSGTAYYEGLKRQREYFAGEPGTNYRDPDVDNLKARTSFSAAQAYNERQDSARARAESGYYSSDAGKASPYLDAGGRFLGGIVNSAVGLKRLRR